MVQMHKKYWQKKQDINVLATASISEDAQINTTIFYEYQFFAISQVPSE